jgi:NADH-quinone oxidoreductase subunit I
MAFFKGLLELIKGMGITGKHLGRRAITLQYPEEKWPMPERSRGVVVLLSDKETGELNCTACELCEKACPTRAITIDAPRGEDKKKHLKVFIVDNTLCCFCGLCEDACNFCAIKMAPIYYEMATYDKSELIWDKDKLQEMGRNVDYVDTRKKKPVKKAAKPAVEKKPAAEEKKPAAEEKQPATEAAPADPAPGKPADDASTSEVKKDTPDTPDANADAGEAKDNG